MFRPIAFLCLLLLTISSQASYLYWRINESDREATGIEALTVKVFAKNNDSGNSVELKEVWIEDMPDSGAYINLDTLANPSAYSFYVELLNYNETAGEWYIAGISETPTSYADMVSSKYIDTGTKPITPVAIWHGGSIVIPEPTTGMLVMFGFGLMALKRREKIGPTECRREIS